MNGGDDRAAAAGRLRDFFGLQLRFAGRLSALTGRPLGEVVGTLTNIRRRFGLATEADAAAAALWRRYVEGLEAAGGDAERLAWTTAFYPRCPEEPTPAGRTWFGCFGFDPPDGEGVVHIHFLSRDSQREVSPLHVSRKAARRAELRAMFAFVLDRHAAARTVHGGSWLYNLEAYRRLFPGAYGDSRAPRDPPVRLTGSSSWGQFLDHQGHVKAGPAARFIENLDRVEPDAPWLIFPLQALRTSAPIDSFARFYGL